MATDLSRAQLRLTSAQVSDLVELIQSRLDSGEYFGPREQYRKRLIKTLKALGAEPKPEPKTEHTCKGCGYPVASAGLCGECSCEEDGDIW